MSESLGPFDFVKSIQSTKQDLVRGSSVPAVSAKAYNPYITNRALSFYVDSVLYANEMNSRHWTDPDMQYAYHLHSVRKMNRKHVWLKKAKEGAIQSVSKYFRVNTQRAIEIAEMLSDEDIAEIDKSLSGGGVTKKR